MAHYDVFHREPADRATSPALSNISELTIFSRSPSPVPDYHEVACRVEVTVPLTPPSSPRDGQFTPRAGKRTGSPDMASASKKPRSPRELQVPRTPMTPQSPRAARSTRKHFEDAVRTSPKSVVTTSALWVAGKGGCGTLEILPKEIRQKIYGYAFDISTPITVKKCCGPEATIRERRACRKHGTGATTKASRFNMLQVSKAMSSEALWVVRSQGSLHLEVDRALTQYLGCYRWNGQRQFLTSRLGCKRKMTMWASAGKYRHVEVAICKETLLDGNPVIHTNYLVDIASSLCQSWLQTSSINATAADSDVKRTVKVKLGSLFQDVLPFNTKPYGATSSWELNEWMYRYYLLSNSEPDLDKIAADSGHNLLRLVAVIAKYRGCSQWEIVANTQLHKDDKVGLGWLHVIQAECARHGMCLEDAGSE